MSRRDQIKLSEAELLELLEGERIAVVSSLGSRGWPHSMPMWFVPREGEVWVWTYAKSQKVRNLERDPRATVLVEAGHEYGELRGAVLYGRFDVAAEDPKLPEIRRAFGRKYWGDIEIPDVKSHVWLRLVPEKVVSWDFRKIPSRRDSRLEATREGGSTGA